MGSYFNVGLAPFPKSMKGYTQYCYPYKTDEGLIGHCGKAFTWSRDDLIDARGDMFARFMRETGVNTFYLHVMDTGGRDNPENWNHRTAMDRKRWGDDRAAAGERLVCELRRTVRVLPLVVDDDR